MSTQGISIRRSLLRSLVLLTLLTSGAILIVTIIAGRNAVKDLSSRLIAKASEQTEQELQRFFGSVRQQVLVGQRWAANALLDADDPLALNDLFVPILEQNPQISSMMVSESEGTGYLLLRQALDRDEWLNRVVYAGKTPVMAYTRNWNTRTGSLREETLPMDYDARTRLWYLGSIATEPGVPGNDIHWTKPVIFFITKDPGITAGSHFTSADGRSIVVAYDLLLLDIARLTTQRVRPSSNGTAFVLFEDGDSGDLRVVGLPRDPRYRNDKTIKDELIVFSQDQADDAAQLPLADDFAVGPVAAALKGWREGGKQDGATFQFEHRESREGGEDREGTWWGELRAFDVGQNRFWIGVAVPESDFLGEVARQRDRVAAIAIIALIAAILMAILLARNYSRPLEQLVNASRRIRDLDLDVDTSVKSSLREVNVLAESQRELVSAMLSFVRYVPLEVVRELVKRGEVAQIGGRTQALTILFTDIRGFTSISERMDPQALAEHMAEYFNVMLKELGAYDATVDKFVGDAIVAFWGAPRPDDQHATKAISGTLACMRGLAVKNAEWEARGLPAMPTRFGLASGEVVVGNIGADSRLSYTVLGDRVNLAARLEGLNKVYGTDALVADSVMRAAGAGFAWRRVDRVAVKGKSEAVDIYEPLGSEAEVAESTIRFARSYEAALDLYQAGDFAAASASARELLGGREGNLSIRRLIEAAERYAEEPPPEPWDCATRLDSK